MLAFGLSLLVFFLFAVMGFSLVPKKFFEFDRSFAFFISPAIGFVVSILFIFTFSRVGFPIKEIKIPFLIYFLVIVSIGLYRHKTPQISRRTLLKFIISPFGILFTAWPILRYGFSWISYVNDDMNNYVLGAMRFLNNGFFAKPNTSFLNGVDYSQEYYIFHVTQAVRPGSELYLATFSNLHAGNILAIFMPSLLSLQLILISSTLALSRTLKNSSKKKTRLAYVLAILLPMVSLGFLYQLIGQVGGLAISIAILAILFLLFKENRIKEWIELSSLLGLFLAVQMIWYPELLPFLLIIFFFNLPKINKIHRRAIIGKLALVLIISFALLNRYFFQAIKFATSQILGAQKAASGKLIKGQLFPYFLKPHGLESLLGLSPLNKLIQEPGESIFVLLSIGFLIYGIYFIFKRKIYSEIAINSYLLLLAVFLALVVTGNGFGSFKMAMYIQPFLILLIISILDRKWLESKKIGIISLSMLAILGSSIYFEVKTSEFYTSASTGTTSNGFNEIQGGSGVGLENDIKNSLLTYRSSFGTVTSPALNLSQIKLEAISAKGIPLIFPTTDIFSNFNDSRNFQKFVIGRQNVSISNGHITNTFEQPTPEKKPNGLRGWYLISNNVFEALNHSKVTLNASTWNYKLVRNPQNTLLFIDSSMGHSYYSFGSQRNTAVIFQPEKNPLEPGTFFQSIGDNLLLEIVNPTMNPHLILNISNTVIPQYDRALPKISIWGANPVSMPIEGRGSARINVPLKNVFRVNGYDYFQIHIDQTLLPFPSKSSIISKLYGANVELDSRRIALFASNISVVDGSELQNANTPESLKIFPTDLENPNLYYSGIYEDGWISTDSYFDLRSGGKSNFSLSGTVPIIGHSKPLSNSVTISIDGIKVHTAVVRAGEFNVTFPVSNLNKSLSVHHVEIHFSREQILPAPDGRPAVAQITYLGFN